MKKIIQLMNHRNHCLHKYNVMNKKQLKEISNGNVDNLEKFYKAREEILCIIDRVEGILYEEIKNLRDENGLNSEKEILKEAMLAKDNLITEILDQDLQIISLIEELKAQFLKEIKKVSASHKAIKAYAKL